MSDPTTPPPSRAELDANSVPAILRRSPVLVRAIATGALLGAVVGASIGAVLPGRGAPARAVVALVFALGVGLIGGLVGGAIGAGKDNPVPEAGRPDWVTKVDEGLAATKTPPARRAPQHRAPSKGEAK